MIKEEYEVLYRLEGKYWWFLGQKRIAFSMLKRHLKRRENREDIEENKKERREESKEESKEGKTKAGLKILDAGCGTGQNMEYLQKYGQAYGLDFSEEALKFCRKRGLSNLQRGEIESLPYADNTFDLVTCFGVLYHQGIKDDFKAIRELQRVCKPGGYVLITTPAGEFLTSPLFASRHDRQQHTGRRHSKARLRRLMENSGLPVMEISYMNMFLMPFVVLMRLVKNILPPQSSFRSELQMPPPWVNKFLLSVLLMENQLIKLFSLPFGLTVVGVGRKKELCKQP